ncbi:ABC-2 type transport system ATP-binding protein [Oceanihabitans sediminis]|uniref:ABC transporter ATP-binding protein n=1 Tax=Oceanihabitans sediminis TaxID=1812012 RepID=A0A368P5P3_9FLAO|nr:ABC transporter ATP-binding protein [Oceanihabitans sediminis]MDX1772863.1 ABC transporter ATP-binding protein [Oceanihabitans sediminis]RBP34541.1 ABC-2 type transport system ATP-binding protein [Oceanihabitans sediminis]RCU58207.1 ABC transporter ATP-binding protein [Oceanihabitans sediminis]
MIQIDKISKKYKTADVFSVSNLDLNISENEIFGLLGPNGAGKTTLISILCSLVKPTSGTFSINGLNYQQNKNELKQLIGIVPQEYALYPTLTAFENLKYFGSMYGLHGKTLKNRINQYLEILGLSQFANKKIDTFSGGMKRRINLIASILHEPKVLFLDEPTVGVDVQSKNVIIEFLQNLNKKGTTIIYTSHHLNEAETFCTRVAIIDHGKLITKGKPADLISNHEGAHNLEDVFLRLTGKALRDHA